MLARISQAFANLYERPLAYVGSRPVLALILPGALHLVLAWLVVGRFGYPAPLVPDEFSYLLGADTFASGRLANPTHPLWVYFETVFVLHVPTYVSMYHPAQALFLAAGQRFAGHPWYGVAASAALMCVAVAWMLRAWMPPRWAVLGSLLAVQMAIAGLWWDQTGYWTASYWGGAVAGIGGALVLGALGRLRRRLRAADAVLFGVGVAILATSRPYEGLLLIMAVGGVLVLLIFRGHFPFRAWLRRFVVPAGLVIALALAALAYYCYRTTGNPLRLPYQLVLDEYMVRRMFYWGEHQPKTYRHRSLERHYRELLREQVSPKEKVVSLAGRLARFYFGPVLVLVLLMLPWVLRDKRFRPLLIGIAVVLLGVSFVEWVHIHYIAPIAAALIALTVQCLRHIAAWRVHAIPVGRAAVAVLVLAGFLVTARQASGFGGLHRSGWWVEREHMIRKMERSGEKHVIVVRYSDNHPPFEEWIFNAADIDASRVVWAREMSDNQPLLRYFADRKVWLLQPDRKPLKLKPYLPHAAHSPGPIPASERP